MCAPAIYAERAREVTTAVAQAVAAGMFVYMATFTIRHGVDDDPKVLRTALSQSFSRMFAGRKGKDRKERIGKLHHIRNIESTWGRESGFHPHIHTILFLSKALSEADCADLRDAWIHSVSITNGFGPGNTPDLEHAVRIDECHRSEYISKLGLEVAAVTGKAAKNGNSTMWEVANLAADGSPEHRTVWHKYVRAMKGCRQLVWSKGAKRAFRIKRIEDDEIAARDSALVDGEPIGVAITLARWEPEAWDGQVKHDAHWLTSIVESANAGTAKVIELPGQSAEPPGGFVVVHRPKIDMVTRDVKAWELPNEQLRREARAERRRKNNESRNAFLNWLDSVKYQKAAETCSQ